MGRAQILLVCGMAALIACSGLALARLRSPAAGASGKPVPSLSAAGRSVFPLLTEVSFDTGEGTPTRTTVEGSGTVFFGRFVLTVAHAVTLERLEATVRTPRGERTVPLDARRTAETTYLMDGDEKIPLTALAQDAQADIALFLLPRGTHLPSFPYPVGDSEALELGDPVALLESDAMAGVIFRSGSVAGLRGTAAAATVSSSRDLFLISLGLTQGESGAPILGQRGGAHTLVGLAQGTYVGPRQLGWAIRIGPALRALERGRSSPEMREFRRLCCGA
jgi:hypothetical protein